MFPVSRSEMRALGWDRPDILLVTGDAFVDHPSFGVAVIARVLQGAGYRVAVLAQPDPGNPGAFMEMGIPRLFAGITPGNMDSMVNHYTSLNRLRSDDSYSPGGLPGKRPDRAELKYANVLQRVMKGVPLVLGGLGPSTRRVSHYDFWSDRVRKSVLLDAKADILVYGMAENTMLEVARRLDAGEALSGIRGTCRFASVVRPLPGDVELPSHEEAASSPEAFLRMTRLLEENQNPWNAARLLQRADTRTLVVEPPAFPLTGGELDGVYALPFTGKPHPSTGGDIPAWRVIRHSITVVRGCPGGCTFCALGFHQGKFVTSRSERSVLEEAKRKVRENPGGLVISDLGGPTANVYGLGCRNRDAMRACRRPSCLYPEICRWFETDQSRYVRLLGTVSALPGVAGVFVSSGVRYDLALQDPGFMRALAERHVPGHLKIAPEHTEDEVLKLMRKPAGETWSRFCREFRALSAEAGKEQYILPYIIAAFPGCTMEHMRRCRGKLEATGALPRQVQIFLPTPMTIAAAMYHTGLNYFTGEPLKVPRRPSEKNAQKGAVLGVNSSSARRTLRGRSENPRRRQGGPGFRAAEEGAARRRGKAPQRRKP